DKTHRSCANTKPAHSRTSPQRECRATARKKEKEVKEEEKTQHCDAAALQARYHHTGAAGPKPALKKLKKLKKKTKKMRFFDADVKLPMQSRV
ncbi:MAG: hypothetical protein ACRC8O_07300, partial [Plesiomonas shigelloides]